MLHLEQILTTGGGWQDQCGGLYGGLKISWSDKKLPVHVQTRILGKKNNIWFNLQCLYVCTVLESPDDFIDKLNKHLVLVYTGKTRLARNLLQDVLRNWHSRDAKIMQTMHDLIQNAKNSEEAIRQGIQRKQRNCLATITTNSCAGDLAALGACLNSAQQQKLVMAPGKHSIWKYFLKK